MPTEDEIRLRLLLEAQQLFKAVDDSIVRVRLLEDSFKSLSSKGKEYLTRLADELKAINKTKVEAAAKLQVEQLTVSGKDKKLASQGIMAAARKEIANYNRDVDEALQNTLNYEKLVAEVLKNNVKTLNEAKQIKFDVKDFPIVKNLKEAQTQVKNLKQIISEYAAQSGASFREVGAEILKNAKAAGMTGEQYKQLQKNVGTAVTQLNKASVAGRAFAGVGKLIQNAFSFFLGGSIFMAISRLINGFQELVKTGEEYAQTIYRLGVSINQLQRRGMAITVKEEIALIKELRAEYETFSQRGVIGALAAVQMLTRNFGFSQEQIRKTTELSMDLALVQGKDVAETAKQLALFYSSGYGEGLQHAGLAVNRLTVANEAHRMGLKKTYMELSEIERAQAAYNLVTRQTQDLHNDAMKIQDNIIGQIKEQRAGIEDITNEIALKALPIELAWLKVKLWFVEALKDQIDANEAWWNAVKKIAKEQGKDIEKMTYLQTRAFVDANRKAIEEMSTKELEDKKAEWEKILSGTLDVEADINLDLSGGEDELADKRAEIGEMIIDLYNDLEDIQADYADKSAELTKDHMDELAEIDKEGLEKQREIFAKYQEDIINARQDYQDKLADIEQDLAQDIADAQTDYYRDLEDIARDYRNSVQDANRKYHDEEVKAERDYQEKMRRLREEYLFDLEDALRERDALQVIRLMRRYALDKQQAERENEQNKQSRAEDHRRELEDLRRQAEEKRRDAQIALQREIADAQLAAQRKREDAQRALEQQLADIQAEYEKERAEALSHTQELRDQEAASYAERQTELDKDLQDRKDKLAKAFGEELVATGASLEDVKQLFAKYFGDKGLTNAEIDKYISKITESANSTSANAEAMIGYINTLTATVQADVIAINTALGQLDWTRLSMMQQANTLGTNIPGAPAPVHQLPTSGAGTPSNPANKKYPGYPAGWYPPMAVPPGYPAFAGGVDNMLLTRPQLFMAGEVPEVMNITPVSQLKSEKIGGATGGKNGKAKVEITLGNDLEGRIVDNALSEFDIILTKEMSRK